MSKKIELRELTLNLYSTGKFNTRKEANIAAKEHLKRIEDKKNQQKVEKEEDMQKFWENNS